MRRLDTVSLRLATLASTALVAVVLLVPGLAAAQAGLDSQTFARVDDYIVREMEQARIPGVAVAVVQGGRIVHSRGFGTAGDADMTPRTPVLIGSLTKSMTAVAIMQLVEAGRVELDAPVQQYLPAFRMADPAMSTGLTVRHLLTHASGIPPGTFRTLRGARAVDVVALLANVRPDARPGAKFDYSNANYVLLGAIVEKVSGQPYEQYVHSRVLDPVGMTSSYASMEVARQHGLATGYHYFFGRPLPVTPSYPREVTAAGFISASAQDMARYLIMLLSGGSIEGARILGSASVDELLRPRIDAGELGSYGMGWLTKTVHGRRVAYHTGSVPDATNTYALMVPDEGWGVVVLVNAFASGRGPQRDALAVGVRDILMQQTPAPVPTRGWGAALLVHGAIFALQVFGILHALRLFRRWRRDPASRPTSRIKRLGWHVVLPALGCAVLAISPFIVPPLLGTSLPDIRRSAPDAALLIVLSALLAAGWAVVRTIVALRSLRSEGSTITVAGHPAT